MKMFVTINELKHNKHPFLEIVNAYIEYMLDKIFPHVGMCYDLT